MSVLHPAVNLLHAAVIGPAVAYAGYKSLNDELEISENVAKALVVIGIIVILFHLYRLMTVSYPAYKDAQKQSDVVVIPEFVPENAPVDEAPAEFMSAF